MKASERSARPRARVEGIIVKELADEVLVYDLDSHKAHCLNGAAAAIWKHFDGKTTISEVATRSSSDIGDPVDPEVVLLALRQLRKAKLVLADAEAPRTEANLSRRNLIKRIGVAGLAATALPLVTSILAPTAYATGSCGSTECTLVSQCPFGCTRCVGGLCAV